MRLEDKLAAYLEYCEYRKELDRKTLKAYRIDLRQYFEYVCVDEPDKEKIEEYITHLHKSYKQKTVKRKIASIKAFYNYLEETEIIAESPFRKIKVKFKETEAKWRNRKAKRAGREEYVPIYDMDDTIGVLQQFRPCNYDEKIRILENVEIRFHDIGHLLGSSCIEIWITESGITKKTVFSGDVGNTNQPIIKDPTPIYDTDDTDYLVIESTYGNRFHTEVPDYITLLAGEFQRTFDRGGNVVIPSFAVGRTQELLYYIRQIKEQNLVKGYGDFSVYVDSPLANEATAIFLQCDVKCLDEEARALVDSGINPLTFSGLKLAVSTDESVAINFDEKPKVIISSSGMCEAGRIRHHLKHNLWD